MVNVFETVVHPRVFHFKTTTNAFSIEQVLFIKYKKTFNLKKNKYLLQQ